MKDQLCIKNGQDVFSLRYDTGVSNYNCEENACSDTVVIPHTNLSVYVNISINGCRTDWSQWKLLNDAIAQSMTESGIWNSLQYQPSLHIDNDENTGFKLNLKCQQQEEHYRQQQQQNQQQPYQTINLHGSGGGQPVSTHKDIRNYAEQTLGSDNALIQAVKLPQDEDINEWLAIHV
ncbi:hypothetical protein QCA50_017557 [Cerrena zonata]|uniref:Uncharacterized protein n=1 Tax=Cerrena zonata TaxID=2478898 RepID=A0AAW0FJX6_9APHY